MEGQPVASHLVNAMDSAKPDQAMAWVANLSEVAARVCRWPQRNEFLRHSPIHPSAYVHA